MIIERAAELEALGDAVSAATAGHGQVVLVGGEAGVGKTTLVRAACRSVPETVRVRVGVADNITTAGALGCVLDAVPELVPVLAEAGEVGRPALFRKLVSLLASVATVLVLEDLHWADEATLAMVGYLGRRLEDLPLLVIATYRSDEVDVRPGLAALLGVLSTAPGVRRLPVRPLSADGVASLVAVARSPVDPVELYARTGGNAFYATEVLAAGPDALPESVRSAVLGRVARLPAEAQDVLAAAAVIGQPVDTHMLLEVADAPTAALDDCLHPGLLVGDADGWSFRHDLARQAVADGLPPSRLLALNRRVLDALNGRGSDDDRRLAHHAGQAGDREAALAHARRAAARAARLGAHHEAAAQYRTVLRYVDDDERHDVLVSLSYECYLTNDVQEAMAARKQAMDLAEVGGDREAVGRHQRWMSRLSWFGGRNADSDRYARAATETLEPLGDSAELAMAYSNRSQMNMLANDAEGTLAWGQLAVDVSRRVGDAEAEMHALNNMGTVLQMRGDRVTGAALLRRSLDLATAAGAEEHVARAYTNIGSDAQVRRDPATVAHLEAGIAYCEEHDLDAWTVYMSAHLAHALAERGHYDLARDRAADVLVRTSAALVTRIVASVVTAQVAQRRGEDTGDLLERAWTQATRTGEAQRLVAVAAAVAEAAWLAGDTRPAGAALDLAWAAATAHPFDWEVGEVAYWRLVAGLPLVERAPVAEPFALMLAGEWEAAAAFWAERECPLWQALALARLPGLEPGRQALDIADRLGAPAVREALMRDRHRSGLPVPRGPRAASRAHPALLTLREQEVLGLLADGLTNAEIAARMFLSEKTVAHHVSAVLRKLGEPTRARAVAAGRRRGLQSPDAD